MGVLICVCAFCSVLFRFLGGLVSPAAFSLGVSAQIGSGVVRGGPEVRIHESSTRVSPQFHEVLQGGVVRAVEKGTACCWGYHLSLFGLGLDRHSVFQAMSCGAWESDSREVGSCKQ